MDANKLKVLQGIRYSIPPQCGICKHADFRSQDGWGYCGRHHYKHGKHSEGKSRLSIHRMGSCSEFSLDQHAVAALGLHAYSQFLPEEPK